MKNLYSSAAFANPAPAAAPAATTPKAGAPKAEDRVAPIFTGIRTDLKPPVSAKRGAKSELAAQLEKLELNASLGLANKTKKQISSTISKVNNAKENQAAKKDANGVIVMKQGAPITDASGAIVGYQPSPGAEMEKVKEFVAYDTDAKADPDKATVRIFRIK